MPSTCSTRSTGTSSKECPTTSVNHNRGPTRDLTRPSKSCRRGPFEGRLRDNVLAKVPKNAQAQVKADYWAIFDVPDTIEPGLDAVGYVQKRIDSFEKRWRDAYPAAVRCLLDDRDSLTVNLRFPREHWTQGAALELHRTYVR